jgi:hypothetical protein
LRKSPKAKGKSSLKTPIVFSGCFLNNVDAQAAQRAPKTAGLFLSGCFFRQPETWRNHTGGRFGAYFALSSFQAA